MAAATVLSPEMRPASPRRLVQRGALHQPVDALVHVAEPLLQAHHRLAVGGEAEVAGLDDPRVHGTDGDLVQRRTFGGIEGVGVTGGGVGIARAQRLAHAPAAVVEPAAGVGRAIRLEAVEIANGALEPQRRRVRGAD